jgi:hypothetical protein
MISYKPKIGQDVEVIVDFSDSIKASAVWRPSSISIKGKIIQSEEHDIPKSFRIATLGHSIPVAVIPMMRVSSITECGKEIKVNTQATKESTLQENISIAFLEAAKNNPDTPVRVSEHIFQVKGSKGDLYTVTYLIDRFTCNCVAGSFGKKCKHVKQIEEIISKIKIYQSW